MPVEKGWNFLIAAQKSLQSLSVWPDKRGPSPAATALRSSEAPELPASPWERSASAPRTLAFPVPFIHTDA